MGFCSIEGSLEIIGALRISGGSGLNFTDFFFMDYWLWSSSGLKWLAGVGGLGLGLGLSRSRLDCGM